jgi:hypothetical protein
MQRVFCIAGAVVALAALAGSARAFAQDEKTALAVRARDVLKANCFRCYGPYPGDEITDPTGPARGSPRVNRGGSRDYPVGCCDAARHVMHVPVCRRPEPGFHLVRSVPRGDE